ncbi:MAG: BlaI/MecI/CopY family transcriptional regulator [Ferruginibacter sp.]
MTIEKIGRIYRYHPAVSKDDYSKSTLTNVANGSIEGSLSNVILFLVVENKLSPGDLEIFLSN